MNTVEKVLAERKISASIKQAPPRDKGRTVLRLIDNMLEDKKLADELKGLDSYD